MDDETRCVACGRPAGYNRAVVDDVAGRRVGDLCRNCELESFGRVLERGVWDGSDECVCCNRDGHVALPVWRPYVERDGGADVCDVAYSVGSSSPRLCDEHYHDVAGVPTMAAGDEATRPRPR